MTNHSSTKKGEMNNKIKPSIDQMIGGQDFIVLSGLQKTYGNPDVRHRETMWAIAAQTTTRRFDSCCQFKIESRHLIRVKGDAIVESSTITSKDRGDVSIANLSVNIWRTSFALAVDLPWLRPEVATTISVESVSHFVSDDPLLFTLNFPASALVFTAGASPNLGNPASTRSLALNPNTVPKNGRFLVFFY